MKRFFLVTCILTIAVCASAQSKGDMYISGSMSISGGNSKTAVTSGSTTTTTESPGTTSFNIGPEFGYFIIDNLSLNLGLGYSLDKTYRGKEGDSNLWNKTGLFTITPGVNYFVKLCNKVYYTPGVSLELGFGNTTRDITTNTKTKNGAFEFGIDISVLSFEIKPCEHFGITLCAGALSYKHKTTSEEETELDVTVKTKTTSNKINFGINTGAEIGFKYYF